MYYDEPFIPGFGAKLPGANFYPPDMTAEEYEVSSLLRPDLASMYTMVRRDPSGSLLAIPHHEFFSTQVRLAVEKLRQAASLIDQQSLQTYLNVRADALLTDDYRASDVAWMEMKDNTIDILIGPPPETEETIATAVSKPTIDLLVRAGETFASSPLLPWVSKIDWMLETILKSLVKSHPGSVAIARLTDVDISAGGLGFDTPRQFRTEDLLVLKMILPPFSMIEATARIIRVTPAERDSTGYHVATQFVELGGDEQELIIRHILSVQAERLRARKAAH